MQKSCRPPRAAGRPAKKDQVALPAFKLAADDFAFARAIATSGQRDLQALYEWVAVDLIDKHEIVAKDLRQGLEDWLKVCIPLYFQDRLAFSQDLTKKEADDCRSRIAKRGDQLCNDLCELYGLGPFWAFRNVTEHVGCGVGRDRERARDIVELMKILSRAEQPRRRYRASRDNRSNRALDQLGDDICWFWMTGWTGRLDQDWDLTPPDFSQSSNYFKFAR
jgi:hypothetical protein